MRHLFNTANDTERAEAIEIMLGKMKRRRSPFNLSIPRPMLLWHFKLAGAHAAISFAIMLMLPPEIQTQWVIIPAVWVTAFAITSAIVKPDPRAGTSATAHWVSRTNPTLGRGGR